MAHSDNQYPFKHRSTDRLNNLLMVNIKNYYTTVNINRDTGNG